MPVEQEVPVGPDAPRPLVGLVGPHGAVVVEVVGQVVGHQVLPAHPQVHRVPVLELPGWQFKRLAVFRATFQATFVATFQVIFCPLELGMELH